MSLEFSILTTQKYEYKLAPRILRPSNLLVQQVGEFQKFDLIELFWTGRIAERTARLIDAQICLKSTRSDSGTVNSQQPL